MNSKDSPVLDLPRDHDRTKDKPSDDHDLDLGASDSGFGAIIGALLLLPLLMFI